MNGMPLMPGTGEASILTSLYLNLRLVGGAR
jgi:hypothetical protein